MDAWASAPLLDSNCGLGRWPTSPAGTPTSAAALWAALSRNGLSGALVYSVDAVVADAQPENVRLVAELEPYPTLEPAWVLMPHYGGEMDPPEALAAAMRAAGVRAARLFPREQAYSLRMWQAGELLATLEAHGVPVWVDFGQRHWAEQATDWDGLAEVCAALPRLNIVLCSADMGGSHRLCALLSRFPNLHVETSYYTVHRGVELLCTRFGAERVLLGTGMPMRAAGPALTGLAYAGLDEEARALVGGGNLQRLLRRAWR
jgi:predicted TIM-barrel fold metal-dependent hydrolase